MERHQRKLQGMTDLEGDKFVVCRVCKREFRNLTRHIMKHGMTVGDYKHEFGVDFVVCRELRRRYSQHHRVSPTYEPLMKLYRRGN